MGFQVVEQAGEDVLAAQGRIEVDVGDLDEETALGRTLAEGGRQGFFGQEEPVEGRRVSVAANGLFVIMGAEQLVAGSEEAIQNEGNGRGRGSGLEHGREPSVSARGRASRL